MLGTIRQVLKGALSSGSLQTMARITFSPALSEAQRATERGGRADGGAPGIAAKW